MLMYASWTKSNLFGYIYANYYSLLLFTRRSNTHVAKNNNGWTMTIRYSCYNAILFTRIRGILYDKMEAIKNTASFNDVPG